MSKGIHKTVQTVHGFWICYISEYFSSKIYTTKKTITIIYILNKLYLVLTLKSDKADNK